MKESEIKSIIKSGSSNYSTTWIPKPDSKKKREINEPCPDTKMGQYIFLDIWEDKLPSSDISKAYIIPKEGKTKIHPTEYIKEHLKYPFTVEIDIRDFFPSIRERDIYKCFADNGFIFTKEQKDIINNLIFMKGKKGLPMGSASSPFLSNAVMYQFDLALTKRLNKICDDYILFRYSDNIYVSCNSYSEGILIKKEIIKLIHANPSPKFRVNKKKTKLNRKGEARNILGIFLTNEGRLSIGGKNKTILCNMLHKYKKSYEMGYKELCQLEGRLGYAKYIDKIYYEKLVESYGKNLIKRLHKETALKRVASTKKKIEPKISYDTLAHFIKSNLVPHH